MIRGLTGSLGRVPRAAAVVAVLGFVNAVIWGLVTPIWQTPDEWAHVAYVQSLAERGKIPDRDPKSKRLRASSEQKLALDETVSFTVNTFSMLKPLWSKEDERAWQWENQLQKPARSNGGGYTTIAAHPFMYYLVQTPVYWASSSASIISRVQFMRIFSAVMAGLTVFFAWLLISQLFAGPKWLPTTGALCVAFQPMLGFMGGAVNNDILAALIGTIVLYLAVRFLRTGLTFRLGLATALVLGIGVLSKGNTLAFLPVVGLAVAVLVVRYRHRLRECLPGLYGLVFGGILVAIFWVVMQAFIGSDNTGGPSIHSTPLGGGFKPRLFVNYIWNFYLPDIGIFQHIPIGIIGQKPIYTLWIVRFFGNFGWIDVFYPHHLYEKISIAVDIGLVLVVVALVRYRQAVTDRLAEIIVCLAAVVTVTLLVHAIYYPGRLGSMAEQGRYLLPVMGVFGAGVAGACLAFGKRYGAIAGALVVSAMLSLNVEGLVVTALRYYT